MLFLLGRKKRPTELIDGFEYKNGIHWGFVRDSGSLWAIAKVRGEYIDILNVLGGSPCIDVAAFVETKCVGKDRTHQQRAEEELTILLREFT